MISWRISGWHETLSRGRLAHLICSGFGTTPVKQHLLDGVCVGYSEAGGTLNFVYLGDRLISRAENKVGYVLIFTRFDLPLFFFWCSCSISVYSYPPPSFSSFSIMALRACMADVLGKVWALISSLRLSACRRSMAARPPPPPREDASSSRSNTLCGKTPKIKYKQGNVGRL